MIDLLKTLVKWVFILGAASELKQATLHMRKLAYNASSPGLISLGQLNHALVDHPSNGKRSHHHVAK